MLLDKVPDREFELFEMPLLPPECKHLDPKVPRCSCCLHLLANPSAPPGPVVLHRRSDLLTGLAWLDIPL